MAISLSCPSCDKTLKVKDELAGRKVKCPACGSGIAVPAEEKDTTPEEEERPPKKKREAEDEEQPRKKKKKKKSNLGLWIGIGGGAAFLLLVLCGIGAYFLIPKSADKAKADNQAKAKVKEEQKEEPKVEQPRVKNVVVRGMELQELKNMMKQVGLAYHNYFSTTNRAPAKWQDLSPYYEKNAKYDQMLADGTVVFLWNVRPQEMTQGTTNTVLAYEKDAGNNGLRVCLFGDGAVDMLDEEQFKTAPKAQPRK